MASSRVHVKLYFREHSELLDRVVKRALARTGDHVEGTASHLASPRGGLEQTIFRTPVVRTKRGWATNVVSSSPGLYQHEGTLKKLGKKGSARGRKTKTGGGRGVKPLRYLLHGLKTHRHELIAELRRGLS